MAFRGVVATVVTGACDGSSVCGDMHQKIVSMSVSCVEPVWLCLSLFFFSTSQFSGVVRAKPQKVELWCNVKFLDGMPSKPSQWNFPVRELVSGSRPV